MIEVFRDIPRRAFAPNAEDMTHMSEQRQVRVNRHAINRKPDRRNLILASNLIPQTAPGAEIRPPLEYVAEDLDRIFNGMRVVIIAYSGRNYPNTGPHFPDTGKDLDDAAEKAKAALEQFAPKGFVVLHREDNPAMALAQAETIYGCGGNTHGFTASLSGLRQLNGAPVDNSKGASNIRLREILKRKIFDGTGYGAVSAAQMDAAGNTALNLDPPILHVTKNRRVEAQVSVPVTGSNLLRNFGLAIQPHYDPEGRTSSEAETQESRLIQVLEDAPWLQALAMEENTALKVIGGHMTLIGDRDAKAYLMSMNKQTGRVEAQELKHGADLSNLLDTDKKLSVRERLRR